MINALTIDLEPWMCFYDDMMLSKRLDVKGTMQLLDILENCDATTTFFALDVVYEWFPSLLDEIRFRGHEIAFHGYPHTKLNENMLKGNVEKARAFINKYKVKGFRAPKMKITQHDINLLSSAGFIYDSSIYGSFNLLTVNKGIIEVPVSTYPVKKTSITFPRTLVDALKNFEIPFGSGLFVGLLSPRVLDCMIREINRKGQPFIALIHPWQLTGVPRVGAKWRIRELLKLPYTIKIPEKKLRYLLERHTFVSIQALLKETDHI